MWALIPQNFIPLPRHVEDFEVEDKASVSRLGKVEEEGLYHLFQEWGSCLELDEKDMMLRCDELNNRP